MLIGSKTRAFVALLSLVGICVMGYLLYLHYSPEATSFCDLGEHLSCSGVNKSEYAKIFGIPMSALGILYFLGMLIVTARGFSRNTAKSLLFLTIVFLGPSFYLSYIEFGVLENVCVFCELSKILMILIAISLWAGGKPNTRDGKIIIAGIVVASLLGLITYFVQTATSGPDADYTEFAMCLNEVNMKMYGSATCQFCARQRALFGQEAFEHVGEIECDPRNPGDQAELCIAKNIEHTPTWILEDDSGNELHRFDPGVQALETLAEVSGCSLPSPDDQVEDADL